MFTTRVTSLFIALHGDSNPNYVFFKRAYIISPHHDIHTTLQDNLPTLEKATVCEIPDQAKGNLLIIAVVIIKRQLDTPVKGDIATFAQTNARLQ